MERKTRITEVFDTVASNYAAMFTPIGEEIVSKITTTFQDHCLDIACGNGAITVPLSQKVGSIVAVDISREMISNCPQLPNVTYQCCDVETASFAPDSFDLITCGFALFFLDDPQKAINKWREWLKPTGRIIISSWGETSWLQQEAMRQLQEAGAKPSLVNTKLLYEGGLDTLDGEWNWQEFTFTYDFGTPSQWWDSLWQQGCRYLLEQVTHADLEQIKQRVVLQSDGTDIFSIKLGVTSKRVTP